ncbi:MAG TPA: transferrin receptor-like dimerization domain-containing protein [Dinghuibacter sp.]|uniref:transferrin receptor-like dimerization domain-containing protein n=1 Tax=Dinghuibacter sp. TaxID=2024697 RepID=UPI002C66DE49|nr:transferrin receptor-like dimerization domain-containing protein [Dinghuibacter sp.]HTJ11661.1 transferrin receptor-like dimerization domain-containing protein [Dinghuibacter sp.]
MRKFLTAAAVACLYLTAGAQNSPIETRFDGYLDAARLGSRLKVMSAHPHHVGSPGDQAVARYIYDQYKSFGFDVTIDTFYVLFPTPKTRELEMTGPVHYKAVLAEPPVPGDSTSSQTSEQLPTYNAWSADGDVSGELVYVGYGLPDDYDQLARRGIDVKGKIVIARYGRSWRGIKPKVAQEHGAIGCIIYSDPKDDGYYAGDVYPEGAFKNEYGVQRGSVMDMPIYPGDPLTPNIGATKDAPRIDRKEAVNLLKIPVLPISYHDAEPLLRSLEGPVAPDDWKGALPFTYHLGPGKTRVHLKLAFNWDMKQIYDVVARVTGSTVPDQWIIRGNHHDGWVNGADDPLSGQSAMLEEAHAIGELLKTGWKPKRTLVYCSWDGEEPGLLGSTEFVEKHAAELQAHAVAYINSDDYSRGFLGVEGSHALEPFLEKVAADVTDPETGVSLLKRLEAREAVNRQEARGFHIGALGSGSDYSPFIQHIGVPSINLGFGGEGSGGEYHSIYDSYADFVRFKDPGFVYGVVLAKTAGRTVLRLSESDVLPFDYTSLSKTIKGYVAEVIALADKTRETIDVQNRLIREGAYRLVDDPTKPLTPPAVKTPAPFLNFAPLQNAMAGVDSASARLAKALKGFTAGSSEKVNEGLYQAEQQLLGQGLPRRPWYRHSIYAPGFYTGYGVKTLPGIREAIEQDDWKETQQQIDVDADILNRFASYLLQLAGAAR